VELDFFKRNALLYFDLPRLEQLLAQLKTVVGRSRLKSMGLLVLPDGEDPEERKLEDIVRNADVRTRVPGEFQQTAAGKKPKGLVITLVVNWLIKPFTMYLLAWFFLKVVFKALIPGELSTEYLAGAVLLGAAPCTAMVFVWSYLSDGDAGYTVVQVAVNDLVILFAFTPIVAFLLGVSDVHVPWDTLLLSVVLFVVIPLGLGAITRSRLIKRRGKEWFEGVFLKKFDGITEAGLLLTLVILFAFQGRVILANPLAIVLIAVPLVIQTYLIFFIGYGWAKAWKVPYEIAAPAGMIGASNFFELSVAVAISLFGLSSGAALATVVGVLTEVPVMLHLVKIAKATRSRFPAAVELSAEPAVSRIKG
jgi:ACR3 family arsenite transporter